MRRYLNVAAIGCVLAAALAAPSVVAAATTTVQCGAGAGLQAAVDAAAAGDTLVIRGTCVGSFIVDKDLALVAGDGKAILDARGSGTVLTIPPLFDTPYAGPTVSISGLLITGGNPAGISNWGVLTLLRSDVKGNAMGIGVGHFGWLAVRDSTVRGNSGDGLHNGDAAYTTVDRSTVSGNGGDGIFSIGQGTVVLNDSTVTANAGRGIETAEFGGVVLNNATVSNNRGGGIYIAWIDYVTLSHSRVIGNTADFGGGIYIEGRRVSDNPASVIADSTIRGNTARVSGGGIYTEDNAAGWILERVTISNNTAGTSGGGIYNGGGPLTLTDVVLRNNKPDNCFGC